MWTLIYLPITICYYFQNGDSFLRDILDFIRGFLFIGEHYNSYTLWYLLSSFYGLVFIYLLMMRKMKFEYVALISNLLMIAGFIFTDLVSVKDTLPIAIQVPVKIGWIILGPRGRIFMGMGYISLGMLLSRYKEKLCRYSWALLIIGMLVSVSAEGVIESLGIVASSFGLFGIIIQVMLGDSKTYLLCRYSSTAMHFVHLFVWTIYYYLRFGEKTYGLESFIVVTMLSFLIGLTYCYIKSKNFNQKKVSI